MSLKTVRANEMGWFIVLGIIAIIIFAIAIFRRNTDRSGIRDNIERAERIRKGIDQAGKSNSRIESGLEELGKVNKSAQGRVEDISKHNKAAKTGIRSAIDILKNAKKRQSD